MVNTGMLQALGGMLDGEKPSEMIATPPSQTTTSPTLTPMQGLIGPGKPQKAKFKGDYDFGKEMLQMGKKNIAFDDKPISSLIKSASQKIGVSPNLLMSSAWIEGLNKAVADPDTVSEAYTMSEKNLEGYPVDGFWNYGLDTFGNNYDKLKQYLPKGFEERFKVFPAVNEKGEKVKTAAFRTNEDALMAKAAMIKAEQKGVDDYAAKNGITLDDDAKDYFAMAAYNGGFGNAKKMLNEYAKAKDKKAFIEKGLTSVKAVHKNIDKRMKLRSTVSELLK